MLNNYVVMNVVDRMLNEERTYSKYDITIQSGCALTNQRIAMRADDEGDNISDRNPVYSELTALYWVWKHEKAEYIGWSHYRRRIEISEEELEELMQQGIDVIMPQPLNLFVSVKEQYIEDGTLDAWNVMIQVLKELEPEYYETAKIIFEQNMLFPYCMGIYKYSYFEKYCSWLFPILEEVYARLNGRLDVYHNRYVAFIAERLNSLYFLHHSNNCKYAICECTILESMDRSVDEVGKLDEKEVVQKVKDLLKKYQTHKALFYLRDVITENRVVLTSQIVLEYKILNLLRYENRYSSVTMCNYSCNIECLEVHYLNLHRYLLRLMLDDGMYRDQMWRYLLKTQTTCYALFFIVDNEIEDKIAAFKCLTQLYCQNGQVKEMLLCMAKVCELEFNEKNLWDKFVRFNDQIERIKFPEDVKEWFK